jgi:hypothetical protein
MKALKDAKSLDEFVRILLQPILINGINLDNLSETELDRLQVLIDKDELEKNITYERIADKE